MSTIEDSLKEALGEISKQLQVDTNRIDSIEQNLLDTANVLSEEIAITRNKAAKDAQQNQHAISRLAKKTDVMEENFLALRQQLNHSLELLESSQGSKQQ